MKKVFSLLVILLFITTLFACNKNNDELSDNNLSNPVMNDDVTKRYKIAIAKENQTYEIISSADKFREAKNLVIESDDENLIIIFNDEILYAKYGVIMLKTKSISENTIFSLNGLNHYTNGHYGIDALFIDTDNFAYKMMINGAEGWINYDEVKLYPLAYVKSNSYYYVNENNELIHAHAKSLDVINDYRDSAALDYAPSFLSKDVKYYSYDGNYFYIDYKDLVKDNREGSYDRAVNKDTPYYSYYQYLPIRALSSYTANDFNKFLEHYLDKYGYTDISILVNSGQEFENIQNLFKLNGAMELVWGLHESGYGTSRIARDKFNIFGMNATDNNPYGNATEFNSLQDGISYHADYYLSRKYLNSSNSVYFGGALGNKDVGFNVSYASDPYWGEKIAAMYFNLDKFLGGKDYNKYQIGITKKPTTIYQSPSNDTLNVIYIETANNDIKHDGLPVVILDEVNGYYKIMLNVPLIDNRLDPYSVFDYSEDCVGYVKIEDIYISN